MKNIDKAMGEMLAASATKLSWHVANSSFEFWQRKDFRLYVDFGNISQTEQDRMFNELEVSALGLFILNFDEGIKAKDEAKRLILGLLQQELSNSFLIILEEGGVEKAHIDTWGKLIDMRLKEYRKDLKIALNESRKMKEFSEKEANLCIAWARIETITIDCLSHIRRGKVEEKDPLWKLLHKWFVSLDAVITPISELDQSKGLQKN